MHTRGRAAATLWVVSLFLWSATVQAQQNLIASVQVTGNEYISRDAILDAAKDALRIGSEYSDQAANAARAAVLRMGYFAEVTVSHEVTPEGVTVTIAVVERKRIEQIAFVGNTVISDSVLQEAIRTRVGHVVDNEVIRRDVGRLEEQYSRQGYIARVAQARVDDFGVLTFVIDEARIEAVQVEGLKRTKDWVVQRLIETKPGELFRQEQVSSDVQRIFNLGIFQNVKTDLRPGVVDPTAVIVVMQIEEKRTGQASVAAAYSELDEFVFMVSVTESNFRGRAERISADVEAFGRTSYDLRFFEPYLDDHNTSMDITLFDTERRRRFVPGGISLANDQFEERRRGASVRLSRPMRSNQRFSVGLQTQEVSGSYLQAQRRLETPGMLGPLGLRSGQGGRGQGVKLMSTIDGTGPPGPGDIEGPVIVAAPLHPPGTVNSMALEYAWDTRDLITDPRKGGFRGVTWQYAGGLFGGDNQYSLYSVEQRKYLSVQGGVLALRLMLGSSSGNVPLFDCWSIGGSMNLRGYEEDRYRGENLLVGNVEYRYSLSDSLGIVGFVDAGDAWGGLFPTVIPGFNIPAEDQKLTLHMGVGVGVRAVTPLGPIRIDWGFGEDGSQVHFGFGQIF